MTTQELIKFVETKLAFAQAACGAQADYAKGQPDAAVSYWAGAEMAYKSVLAQLQKEQR